MTFWQGKGFAFAIAKPFNEEPASNGNGTMIGFNVGSIEEVKRLHQKVIDLGGTCEGEPNQRGPKFSAYARDLDKNKLVFSALNHFFIGAFYKGTTLITKHCLELIQLKHSEIRILIGNEYIKQEVLTT